MSYDNVIQNGIYYLYPIYSQISAYRGLIPCIYFGSKKKVEVCRYKKKSIRLLI